MQWMTYGHAPDFMRHDQNGHDKGHTAARKIAVDHLDFVKPCQKLHSRLSMRWPTMQVDCEIGEVNEEGLRGVRAKRDMQLHQVAVKLPKVMAITLKEWNRTSEVR